MPLKSNLASQVDQLILNQLNNWNIVSKNYSDLEKLEFKKLYFNDLSFMVQFNPARIKSSAAKIDKQTIEKRPCFLCDENRPNEQTFVDFGEEFRILVNPYPIFKQHLTLIHKKHLPQLIEPYFIHMLKLAKELQRYVLFYNGPECGASAPDHFHFQAGIKGTMPIESQILKIKNKFGSYQRKGNCDIWKIDDGIRKFFHIESPEIQPIQEIFLEIYKELSRFYLPNKEPGLNILCMFDKNVWKMDIFPRGQHRPWQYAAPGDQNFIFSPASVDMGGLIVIPLEKDFRKIDEKLALDMMLQVSIKDEQFKQINIDI